MLAGILLAWFVEFGIGYRLYGVHNTPDWLMNLSLLAFLISPLSTLAGIILGIVKRREKHARTCSLLSALGLLENIGLFAGILYLSATF